jgi:hypothetical protein
VGYRTSWRPGWRTASSAALVAVLAGCGGSDAPPTLARTDAASLIALAGRIANDDHCGQAHDIPLLTRKAIALVNSGRVPAGLQEQLISGVNDLAAQAPACVRTLPPAPAPSAPVPPPAKHGPGKARGHGNHGGGEDDQ